MLVEESVYALVPQPDAPKVSHTMYRSRHGAGAGGKDIIPPTASTFGFHGTSKVLYNVAGESSENKIAAPHPAKRSFATFGKAVSGTINPHEFLKKTAGQFLIENAQRTTSPQQRSHSSDEKKRPAIPKREEKPIMGLKTDKNFVVANAVEAILTAPKRSPASADRAVDRPNFGQLPPYLQDIKAQLKSAAANQTRCAEERAAASKAQELSAVEVSKLRDDLLHHRTQLNKQYLTLSVNMHTQSQLKRKEYLERNLAAMDAAIGKLSRKKIMVVDD